MKQGKRLTAKQKKILSANSIDGKKYHILSQDENVMELVNTETGTVVIIRCQQ